jgi:hypothetical protein
MASQVGKALKEWAVVVKALQKGEQVLLLRKGGIVEGPDGFQLETDRFFLFPTFFHQDRAVLKDAYQAWVEGVFRERPPDGRVRIGQFAEVRDVIPVIELGAVTALADHHVWSPSFIADRFAWKPQSPLFILVLRVYQLPRLYEIGIAPEYGGCTSWIDLEAEIPTTGMEPVLDEAAFFSKRDAILNALCAGDTERRPPARDRALD